MKLRSLVVVLALLVPSVSFAGPISPAGVWSATAPPAGEGPELASLGLLPFWDGDSWDGPHMGVGTLINAYSTAGLEYLNDGSGKYTSFSFTEEAFDFTKVFGVTAWSNGTLSMHNGSFSYDNGVGNIYNSKDNPGQFALFRLVGEESIRYFLGVEDIPINRVPNDKDYNDFVVTFTAPRPVPEPGTLLLLGSGIAALAARRKLAARKSVQEVQA